MENQSAENTDEASLNTHPHFALINTFCEITACASKAEALFFLESHAFDLDAAVSTFIDNANPVEDAAVGNQASLPAQSQYSPSESLSASPSPRSRSPSPPPASRPYSLRSTAKPSAGASGSGGRRLGGGGGSGIRTLADLNRNPKDEDSDSDPDFDPQEYYTGGEKSGMLVQDPSKANNVESIFNQARQAGAVEASAEHLLPSSSSRRFAGTARLLSGDVPSATPQPPEAVNHTITFWRNGFTVDDGPLRRLDDPQNASFLESIRNSECPQELAPADKRTAVQVNLTRKEGDYKEAQKPRRAFQGVGRTLGSTNDDAENTVEPASVPAPMTTAPAPLLGLVVDQSQPFTSIQLRLADGTRMVSRFNNHHTIRDIRGFIDASRPYGPRTYQLQSMGFPPKQLADLDQTIDQAGIANSVVIQKL